MKTIFLLPYSAFLDTHVTDCHQCLSKYILFFAVETIAHRAIHIYLFAVGDSRVDVIDIGESIFMAPGIYGACWIHVFLKKYKSRLRVRN